MEQVRHNTLGIGEVVSKEVISGFIFLNVRFENGKEMRFGIPQSFETGVLEALGDLKDEVEQIIAEKTFTKTMPTGPVATAYEEYLINAEYKEETESGVPSTVYSYVNAVESVRVEEGVSWDTLKTNIDRIVSKYDEGGLMSWYGAKSNKTVINALKRFAEFVG